MIFWIRLKCFDCFSVGPFHLGTSWSEQYPAWVNQLFMDQLSDWYCQCHQLCRQNSREWWLTTKRACQWWFRLNPHPCLGLSQNASNFQWSITIFPGILPIEVLWTGVVYSSLPTYFRVKKTPFHDTVPCSVHPLGRCGGHHRHPGHLRRTRGRGPANQVGNKMLVYWQKWRGSFNGYNGLIQGKTLEGNIRKRWFKMYPLNMFGSCKCSLQPILGFWEAINLMQPTNCREDLCKKGPPEPAIRTGWACSAAPNPANTVVSERTMSLCLFMSKILKCCGKSQFPQHWGFGWCSAFSEHVAFTFILCGGYLHFGSFRPVPCKRNHPVVTPS